MKYDSYLTKPELYYWQRTERGTQAEVDYVISRRGKIYPIEVKASNSGSMQSMYKFIELKKSELWNKDKSGAFFFLQGYKGSAFVCAIK